MEDLPSSLVAFAADGSMVHVELARADICIVARVHREASGTQRAEVEQGTWSARGDELELVIGDHRAVYAREPAGPAAEPGGGPRVIRLLPRFTSAVGLLPAVPLCTDVAPRPAGVVPSAPRPRGAVGWIVVGVIRLLMPLPWWLRAPLATAGILVGIVVVRAAFKVRSTSQFADAGAAIGVVAVAGLVGGGVPTLLFVPLRRLGYVGSLLNGLVGVLSYLLACSWAFGRMPADQRSWLIMLGVGGFFGLLVGHVLLHPLAVAARARAAESRSAGS